MHIDGRPLGPDHPPYIIAELSGNHNGDIQRALDTIDMVADCGADAVKIQSYTPDTMTIRCEREDFKIRGGLWDGYTLYDLYQWAHTPFEWHEVLFAKAKARDLTLFSSPFDESAVDLLASLNAPAYKIASFELIDLPLIRYTAQQGKPMLMSTGMADLEEISEAVSTAREAGCRDLVLFHCISGYPTPVEQANLATLQDLALKFDCVVGLSDHTMGTVVSTAAVALGAQVIEKHVTLCRHDKGPDSDFSLEPAELKQLCKDTKDAWSAIGKSDYERRQVEVSNVVFRRSLYFVKALKAGEIITDEHVRRIRPGYGLPPKHYPDVVGRTAAKDIEKGMPVRWEDLQN